MVIVEWKPPKDLQEEADPAMTSECWPLEQGSRNNQYEYPPYQPDVRVGPELPSKGDEVSP